MTRLLGLPPRSELTEPVLDECEPRAERGCTGCSAPVSAHHEALAIWRGVEARLGSGGVDLEEHRSRVRRQRPVRTSGPCDTAKGSRHCRATFGTDQICEYIAGRRKTVVMFDTISGSV